MTWAPRMGHLDFYPLNGARCQCDPTGEAAQGQGLILPCRTSQPAPVLGAQGVPSCGHMEIKVECPPEEQWAARHVTLGQGVSRPR